MKNKFLKIVAVVFVFSTVSCEEYLDINDNPNTPLVSQIPPNQLLSAAQAQTYKAISGDTENTSADISSSSMNQLGNIWMNTWAGNSNNTTGANASEYSVTLTASFYDNIWDYTYRNIANLQNIVNYDSENFDNHKAIAMILKSFYMQYVVDLYGDCPYNQAFLGLGNLYPTYDDDKLVYRALVDQIDQAVLKIDNANASDATVSNEDIMLAGDMSQWKKFANTIKLRLLMRQSGLSDAETVAYIESELTELDGALYLSNNLTLNPGYDNSTTDKQNPFYAVYGFDISGGAASLRSYVTATRFAADALNGTSTGVIDERRGRLFTLQAGAVVGILQGEDAASAPDNPSLIGPAFAPTNSVIGSALPSYVMTLSETKFLLSEAALKYPSHFAAYDPQTMFEDGVTSSFNTLGATLGSYLVDIDAVPGFGWTATTNKVEAIMTQKWIALMHVNAIESWIDQLRTGYPIVPLPITNITGKPKRLMYPTSEYTSNSANLPVQTAANAFSTGPFWLP